MIYIKKIQHITFKLLVLFLALQILNMSVHGGELGRGTPKSHICSIGSFNQIDSFWEFVYENIHNSNSYDDANDEGLHNHAKSHHSLSPKFVEYTLPEQKIKSIKPVVFVNKNTHYPKWKNGYSYLYIQNIVPPPPQKITYA